MLYRSCLICCSPKAPFLTSIQQAKLSEEVLLWLFPFSPLFCVIFYPRELPGNPLWPCTNSSLHDTSEQSRHLASVLPPPCPLYPPPPFSRPQQWHPGQWGELRSTHTHSNAVVTVSSPIPNHVSSETMPGTLSSSLYLYSKAVKWNTVSRLTSNTDPLWPEHTQTHTYNTKLSTEAEIQMHGSSTDVQMSRLLIW